MLFRSRKALCSPLLCLSTVVLALGGCDDPDASPDLETAPRAADQAVSSIERGFATWLDRINDKALPTSPAGVFALKNRSPRLVHLGEGWFGDPDGGTVGIEFLHRGSWERLRETTLIGGRKGETALLSHIYPGSPLSPVLVIRDPSGSITMPLAPVDPDEEALAACLGEAVGKDDFDAVLDCLGLLDTGDGSSPGDFFSPGSAGLGDPNCEGHGIAMAGGTPTPTSSSDVLSWTSEAEDAIELKTYGPPSPELVVAVKGVLDAAEAWHAANTDLSIDPTDAGAQQALLDASFDFGKAVGKYRGVVNALIAENNGGSEPHVGEEPPARDPRCEQQDTDSARGTLFANSDFCSSRDLLDCLAEEMDPIRKITDGKCATVDNPLGGKMLKCNDGSGDPLEVSPGAAPESGSADPLQWTDPTSPPDYQGKTHVRYVDTLDLGHVLIGICAAGGCPPDPRGF